MNEVSFSPDWAYAWGGPVGECRFKQQTTDFIVEELLPFEPEGEGEHVFLFVEKEGENTDWVAGLIGKFARVKRSAVSYAGRKDRHGITRQWFSVWMPGMEEPDWSGLNSESVRILYTTRHNKKLRTGALKGNRFVVTLRDVEADQVAVDERLAVISEKGVPNYFGLQRFGHNGVNLERARMMFAGSFKAHRNKRSMYLSAARSWIFNQIISRRVGDDSWMTYIEGDVPGFQDSGSLILRDHDDELKERVRTGAVSLTAPLWGTGEPLSSALCREIEESVLAEEKELLDGLLQEGVKQERRAIRLIPEGVEWEWVEDGLQLRFSLPKGCFATSVLRELLVCQEDSHFENITQ